jgi:hypothetical protein
MPILKAASVAVLGLFFFGCSTYYLSPDALRNQIHNAVPVEGTFIYSPGGLFLFNKSMNNGIRDLVVKDKDGNEKTLRVSQRTQIRIHKKDGDYSTFYFDTLFFLNDSVIGDRTHFFASQIKPIPFSDITKIELQ